MTNLYKPVSARAKALHGEDDFEAEFTASEEADHLTGGHLAIVPRSYEVLSDNYEAGKQGEVIDLALLVDIENALIEGGHIQRADKKPTTKKKG